VPEEKEQQPSRAQTQERQPSSQAPTEAQRTGAMGEFLNVAAAMEAARQQHVFEAMKLPEKRLDDASENGGAAPYTLRDDGDGNFTKVDAFGNEFKER
jgi:hypothetical protein